MVRATLVDRPKLLGDPIAREMRRAQLMEPHVAPLTEFVAQLRLRVGPEAIVPDFDPWDGGTRARVLFLLEAPGGRAVQSGFVSRNNPDETAKNFFELNHAAGIARTQSVTWNVVPWYIGTGTRIRAATTADVKAGAESLERLLSLLRELRAVVLIGRKAARVADLVTRLRPSLRMFRSPHPSPMFMNRSPENRKSVLAALRRVATYLNADTAAV